MHARGVVELTQTTSNEFNAIQPAWCGVLGGEEQKATGKEELMQWEPISIWVITGAMSFWIGWELGIRAGAGAVVDQLNKHYEAERQRLKKQISGKE